MSSVDISAHLDEREKLIKQDRALRVDAAKSGDLTPTESAADEIVRAMRAREAVSVWGVEQEGIENPFPGMEFLTSKAVIMKTKVFDVLHKVRALFFRVLYTASLSDCCFGRAVWGSGLAVADAEGSVASCPFGCDRRR